MTLYKYFNINLCIQVGFEFTNPDLQAHVRVHFTHVLIANGGLKRTIYCYS